MADLEDRKDAQTLRFTLSTRRSDLQVQSRVCEIAGVSRRDV